MKHLLFAFLILFSACKKEKIDETPAKITYTSSSYGKLNNVPFVNINYYAEGMTNATKAEFVNKTKGIRINLPLSNGSKTVSDNSSYGTGANTYYFEIVRSDGNIYATTKFTLTL
jgi:hypothetical protein